jgi:hypothetical protein
MIRPSETRPVNGYLAEEQASGTRVDAGDTQDARRMAHNPGADQFHMKKCCRAASASSDAARPAVRVGLPPDYP